MNLAPGTSQQYSHTDNVVLGQRSTKQSMKALYDKNIYGPTGVKDTRFPVDQAIQGPVLHAFTMEIARFTRIAPTGTRSGALRRGCPRPTSMTWANGPRSSEPDV
jgi:hypothetical protein